MGIPKSKGLIRISAVQITALLLWATLLLEQAAAASVVVGGENGWTLGIDYKKWAAATKVKRFDTLNFKYDNSQHNVVRVSKEDYDSCNTVSPLGEFSSGEDMVKLTEPGTHYYICGLTEHCQLGLKMAIHVHA
ncbi:hypothetical protein R1sor_011140 [Riccia sorocarpa]|uniref:Phytocyanin domain-containing protein n=1 Tax=Riccia sorocarpa TaxID=122646 RepID=A0ABD3I3H8_9MARC